MDRYGYIGIETLLRFCENSKGHAVTPNDFMRMARMKMPRWIPVTERLPEEDDYRPCYGYEDGAVWWCNDMGQIGLGWHYSSTGEWAYYDESDGCNKCVGNVVAWMPLPKLYRGE